MRTGSNARWRVVLANIREQKQHQQGPSLRGHIDTPVQEVVLIAGFGWKGVIDLHESIAHELLDLSIAQARRTRLRGVCFVHGNRLSGRYEPLSAESICSRWCSLCEATLSNSAISVRTPVSLWTNSRWA